MGRKLLVSIAIFAVARVVNIIVSGDYGEVPWLLRLVSYAYKTGKLIPKTQRNQ
jgi:hypothetical protein